MKVINFKTLTFAFLALAMLAGVSCKKEDDTITPEPDPIPAPVPTPDPTVTGVNDTLKGNITSNYTIKAINKNFLSGFVYVKDGVTITIEAGAVIKGVLGSKGSLIIERGGKIIAQGTSAKPIVFTSASPVGSRSYGDWGGLVLCGEAPTNKHDVTTGIGIAEGGIGSSYGGSNPDDNSGILSYVRIEFAGIPLSATPNSEINGLTLYAVGKNTQIDHIQVSYSGDDSYEWFGGSVNCKYLIAFAGQDDDFDTDNGYIGNVQFAVSLRNPDKADQSESNGFESDNDADGSVLTPITAPVFSNISVFGPTSVSNSYEVLFKSGAQIRRGSRLSIFNSVFAGWPVGLYIDGAKGDSPQQAAANALRIENTILAAVTTKFKAASADDRWAIADSVQVYFEKTSRKDTVYSSMSDIGYTSNFTLTSPNFLPSAGSVLLSGALFTNSKLTTSTFFETVSYRGAFGTSNWTSGWCNFDPQNTVY